MRISTVVYCILGLSTFAFTNAGEEKPDRDDFRIDFDLSIGGESCEKIHGNEGKGEGENGGNGQDSSGEGDKGGNGQNGKGEGKGDLIFGYNTKLGDYFYNADSETAFVMNLLSNNTGFFNGKTGDAFIFSPNNRSTVYLTSSDQTWNVNNESLEDYAENISLEDLFKYGLNNGIEINSGTLNDQLRDKISDITSTLSPDNSKSDDAYSYLLETSISALSERLNEIRPIFRGTKTPVFGDLSWGLDVLRALARFFSGFKDVAEIKSNEGLIDLNEYLSSDSGLESLSLLLKEVAPRINLEENLSDESKTNFNWLFDIIGKLSGNDYEGFNGFLRVVTDMVKYASNLISETELRHILELYFNGGSEKNPDLENKWNQSIEELQNTLDELQLSSVFEDFYDTLTKIGRKNWVYNYMDMSAAIDAFISADFEKESVDKILSKLCREI